MIHARVTKKDPVAIDSLGQKYYFGLLGLQKDLRRAVKLWEEAAALGSIQSLHSLGLAYRRGEGVETDEAKGSKYLKKSGHAGTC